MAASAPPRDFPYWLVAALAIGVAAAIAIWRSDLYSQVFATVGAGLGITVRVTLIGFALASALGLCVCLLGLSQSLWLRQLSRFYIEIIRGIPVLVLLFWIAFVGAPAMVAGWNWLSTPLQNLGLMQPMVVRDFSLEWRAIFALMVAYSSFLAEIFRAGIQAVDSGQIEAGKALGLGRYARFRKIVWPQAFRTILPPYSNDFVAMVKDSSLVSVLGVADITQMAKVYAAGSFRFFETYSILAYIYLLLTISLSLFLRGVEQRLRIGPATLQAARMH
ncbi:amino acid ABC transporter permease [Salmonella enterica subsp. enterica]|nr:amino acid ABC transporter permease [Salmonella enterica subsp. enterica]EBW2353160.1 amino acid ABC transporter permease [Salmonella enterica subsp. enterica serovar Enteritidis]MIL09791.1 amino acid ABC transporter permease [Salmonella enterica subsp. enterica serovar Enteritidis]